MEEATAQNSSTIRVIEDLLHQLRSPIAQAEARARMALATLPSSVSDELRSNIAAVKGLCTMANRVLLRSKLMTELHESREVQAQARRLSRSEVVRILIEVAADAEVIFDGREIECRVERESFALLEGIGLQTDADLLALAVSNLVDNAFKYSYRGTVIWMRGGRSRDGRFYISVTNTGIPIRPEDVRNCFLRGWRGESATRVTSEGSGLGLWITKEIMGALGGEVKILPSEPDRRTQASLLFPVLDGQ